MALRTNQVRSVTFANVGGGSTITVMAHEFNSLEVAPAHDRVETFAGTEVQAGERHNMSWSIRRGVLNQVNSIREVFVGKPVASGIYAPSAGNPDSTPAEWFSVGSPQSDGVSHDIAVATTLGTDQMPLLISMTPSGFLGLRDLSSAQASLLNARHGLPCDLALERSDGTYIVFKEVYPNVPLDINTGAGGYIVRGLSWRRMRTRNIETYAPFLAGDATFDYFNDRMLAGTRIEATFNMIDDGTETAKFSPVGFTVRPMINLAGAVFDGLMCEGVGYGTTSSYITLDPALS